MYICRDTHLLLRSAWQYELGVMFTFLLIFCFNDIINCYFRLVGMITLAS